jgi:hypothetical protein
MTGAIFIMILRKRTDIRAQPIPGRAIRNRIISAFPAALRSVTHLIIEKMRSLFILSPDLKG